MLPRAAGAGCAAHDELDRLPVHVVAGRGVRRHLLLGLPQVRARLLRGRLRGQTAGYYDKAHSQCEGLVVVVVCGSLNLWVAVACTPVLGLLAWMLVRLGHDGQ